MATKVSASTNSPELIARLRKFKQVMGKEVGDAVKQFARLACVDLSHHTQPWGHDPSKGLTYGMKAVERDINKVYSTPQSLSFYYNVSDAAYGYYYAQERNAPEPRRDKNGKPLRIRKSASEKAESFLNRFKRYQDSNDIVALGYIAKCMKFKGVLYDEFDSSYHRRSRNSTTGRVEGKQVEKMLVLGAEAELKKYRDDKKDLVGLTKAGWAVCADRIPVPGRITSNVREFPSWVKKHIGRASGEIADKTSDTKFPHVVMINNTPWSTNALPDYEAQKALNKAEADFLKYLDITIQKTLIEEYDTEQAISLAA